MKTDDMIMIIKMMNKIEQDKETDKRYGSRLSCVVTAMGFTAFIAGAVIYDLMPAPFFTARATAIIVVGVGLEILLFVCAVKICKTWNAKLNDS